jgi:anthranilate phosphoribosyltransferase
MAEAVLDGERGPSRDVVLLNAGTAMYVAGLAESVEDGIARTADELDSGRARAKVNEVIAASQRIKAEGAAAAPKAEVA